MIINLHCDQHPRISDGCAACQQVKREYWAAYAVDHAPTLGDYLNTEPRVARARTTDPETSHEAAALVHTGAVEQQVIQWLRDHGPQTQKEISLGTGIPEISCSPVLRPLVRALVLYNPSERRTNPGTGRRAIAWAVR